MLVDKLINKVSLIYRKIIDYYESHYNLLQLELINSEESGFEIIKSISPETWVKCGYPEVYEMNQAFEANFLMKRQDVLLVEKGIISDRSDLVLTPKGVLWEKAERGNISITVPLDAQLIDYSMNSVTISNFKSIEDVDGRVISLLGVHANLWAHFLVQYLPRLYYAGENDFLNSKITVIVPKYYDQQLAYIVDDYLKNFPNVRLLISKPKIGYRCEKLLYIPSLARLTDHADCLHPSLGVFPDIVGDLLVRNLINRYVLKANELFNNSERYRKLFIRRNNPSYRKTINYSELEDAFGEMGFTLVSPGDMSFIEKVYAFSCAEIVVGPLSGGFINTIFCKPHTKVLEFSMICRTMDSYLTFIQRIVGLQVLFVTGIDTSSNTQTDSFFPINKVLEAYSYLEKSNGK